MAEGLEVQGKKVEIIQPAAAAADVAFAKAMAQPVADIPEPPDAPTPEQKAERKPRTPRKTSAVKTEPPKPIKGEVVKSDYTQDAQQLVTSTWLIMASVPIGPMQALALPLHGNADALAAGLAEGAKKNETIRKVLSSGGDSAWMLQLASAGLSIGIQSLQILKDPELRAACAEGTKKQLKEYLLEQGITLATPEGQNKENPDGAGNVPPS